MWGKHSGRLWSLGHDWERDKEGWFRLLASGGWCGCLLASFNPDIAMADLVLVCITYTNTIACLLGSVLLSSMDLTSK